MRLKLHRRPESEFLLAQEGFVNFDPTRWVCRYRRRHGLGGKRAPGNPSICIFIRPPDLKVGIAPALRPESRSFMASRHNKILLGFHRQAQNMRVSSLGENVSYLLRWRTFEALESVLLSCILLLTFSFALFTICTSVCLASNHVRPRSDAGN